MSSKTSKGRSQTVYARRTQHGTINRQYSRFRYFTVNVSEFREKDISDLNQSESSDTFTKQEASSLLSWFR